MKVKLEEVERYERPMTNRVAFRFGVITVTGGTQAVIVQITRAGSSEAVTDEEVRTLLEPFHVGPDR